MTHATRRRVAIVGAGPAGLYALDNLLEQDRVPVTVDIFDRLPTPWGLVRHGVAPDHPEKKQIADRLFRPLLNDPRVRFFGSVEIGRDLAHRDLAHAYDAVLYTVGANDDNRLNIPGEDLPGVVAARSMVAWYNGHPEHAQLDVNLGCRRAIVIGNGNVALDIARLLARPVADLERTDIADHALDALRASRIEEVVVLGRRARIHAAFHNPELEGLDRLADVDVLVDPGDDGGLPPMIEGDGLVRRMALLDRMAVRSRGAASRVIRLRFLSTPVRLEGHGRVERLVVGPCRVVADGVGSMVIRPTGRIETIDCGLVVRATGFRGARIAGLPFDETRGVIPSVAGRVVAEHGNEPSVYVAGWVKRGCHGMIGSNRKCAAETVASLLEDLDRRRGSSFEPAAGWVAALLASRGVNVVDRAGWDRIDRAERAAGRSSSRPRVKFSRVAAMHAVAGGIGEETGHG